MSLPVNPHPQPDPQPGRASPEAWPGSDDSSPPSLAALDRDVRQLSAHMSDAAVEVVALERVIAVAVGPDAAEPESRALLMQLVSAARVLSDELDAIVWRTARASRRAEELIEAARTENAQSPPRAVAPEQLAAVTQLSHRLGAIGQDLRQLSTWLDGSTAHAVPAGGQGGAGGSRPDADPGRATSAS